MTLPPLLFAAVLFGNSAPSVAAEADVAGPASPLSAGFQGSHLVPPRPVRACPSDIGPIYRASAIVTGTDLRQRPWGFAETLREVLVKASGDPRLADDARTARLAAQADRFVACFDYVDLMAGVPLHDDQGTSDRPHELSVSFVPVRIDAALAQLGAKPWRGARPVVVPVLLVHGPKPPPYLLSAQIPAGAEQRAAFAVAADRFGIRVRVPSTSDLRHWDASTGHLPSAPPASGEAIVVGTLDWNETLPGWVGTWRMRWRGARYAWGIGGVNYDAAFRNIVRGVVLVASGAGPPDRGD